MLPRIGGFSGLSFSCGWFVQFVVSWGGFGVGCVLDLRVGFL